MKKLSLTVLQFLLVFVIQAQWTDQSNWTHVGPKSDNQLNGNGFETSQLNNITIDPLNPDHLFASGWFGGLWESTNKGANWTSIDNTITAANGVSAVTFLNSSEILVGDFISIGRVPDDNYEITRVWSTGIWKYNFVTGAWQALGAIPDPGVPFVIRSLAVYPGNSSIIFACTSVGLFRSGNNGASWAPIVDGFIENIVFLHKGNGTYFSYIAGSDIGANYGEPDGVLRVQESNNTGTSFVDLSSQFSVPSPYNIKSHGKICLGPTDVSGNALIYLLVIGTQTGFGCVDCAYLENYLYSFTKNINSALGAISSPTILTPFGAIGDAIPARLGFAYDPVNNGLWYGGVSLTFLNLSTSTEVNNIKRPNFLHPDYGHTRNGYIHDDMHDIFIRNYSGQYEMYVACDGGIARTDINLFSPANPNTSVYFYPVNNDLHVNLIHGFSGTDNDKDLYAIGGHDVINTDIYDAAIGKNRYTPETWENDGALIDRFDKNKMFLDASNYNSKYYTSENGGNTIDQTKKEYWPDASSSAFEAGAIDGDGGLNFTERPFFQDPYRPGRIFHTKLNSGISQYVFDDDLNKSVFVNKIFFGGIDSDPNGPTSLHIGWWLKSRAMSFSKQTKNSFHFITDGYTGDDFQSRPSVIKYIGNNIDDCWKDHNMATYTDGSGTHPQWANITLSLWEDLGVSIADMYITTLREIETSPWNKNIVYLSVRVPNHPDIKVLKYNGTTWSNYSNGIPLTEGVSSMILDHESNDGIYLSTEKGIYYRDAASTSWNPYRIGLPKLSSSQMEINYTENTVRAGTFGRGIWKSALVCPDNTENLPFGNVTSISPEFKEASSITLTSTKLSASSNEFRAVTSITINPGSDFALLSPSSNTFYELFIHGCSSSGNSFKREGLDIDTYDIEQIISDQELNESAIYPNPNQGQFSLLLNAENDELSDIKVFDVMGKMLFEKKNISGKQLSIDITDQPKGIYFARVVSGDKIEIHKIIIQ